MSYWDMKPDTLFIAEWIGRMNRIYGGTVNHQHDWGQALCIEMYGRDNKDWTDDPGTKDVEVAKRWEIGEFPAWIYSPKHENMEIEQ